LDLTVTYAFHHGFRRDLALFARAAAMTPLGDGRAWWALRRRWALLEDLLQQYERREREVLRPLLLQRTSSAGGRAAGGPVIGGPRETAAWLLLGRCSRHWSVVAADADARARNELHESLHLMREHVGGHLADVERRQCSLLQVHVASTEWARLAQGSANPLPPRSLLGLVLPWLFSGLDRDAASRLETSVGRTPSLVWRASRSAFSAAERRTFGYALGAGG
jgi:hypothetical protein